mmetsp:Transcript_920/g.1933  ORF Transcript_920/g.1933 Transcript_920/m.1933 type:complete len:638 (+) Transcript_920:236-2149(+)
MRDGVGRERSVCLRCRELDRECLEFMPCDMDTDALDNGDFSWENEMRDLANTRVLPCILESISGYRERTFGTTFGSSRAGAASAVVKKTWGTSVSGGLFSPARESPTVTSPGGPFGKTSGPTTSLICRSPSKGGISTKIDPKMLCHCGCPAEAHKLERLTADEDDVVNKLRVYFQMLKLSYSVMQSVTDTVFLDIPRTEFTYGEIYDVAFLKFLNYAYGKWGTSGVRGVTDNCVGAGRRASTSGTAAISWTTSSGARKVGERNSSGATSTSRRGGSASSTTADGTTAESGTASSCDGNGEESDAGERSCERTPTARSAASAFAPTSPKQGQSSAKTTAASATTTATLSLPLKSVKTSPGSSPGNSSLGSKSPKGQKGALLPSSPKVRTSPSGSSPASPVPCSPFHERFKQPERFGGGTRKSNKTGGENSCNKTSELDFDGVFLDLGCGTGKACFLATMSRWQFAKAVGVELLPGLHELATTLQNLMTQHHVLEPQVDLQFVLGDISKVRMADDLPTHARGLLADDGGDHVCSGDVAAVRRDITGQVISSSTRPGGAENHLVPLEFDAANVKLVYIASTVFGEELMYKLRHDVLKDVRCPIVTLKNKLPDVEMLEETELLVSWGYSPCYICRIPEGPP